MRHVTLLLAVLAVLVALPGSVRPAQAGATEDAAALAAKLKKTRLSNVKFEETKLEDVVTWLRVATGFNYHVKRAKLMKEGIEVDDITFTATLTDVSVATLLDLVLEPHDLAVKIKGNVVYITTKKDSYGKPLVRLYGISHITWTKTDFIAPNIDLMPSDGYVEEYEPEVVVEDDPLSSGDAVIELLKEMLMPEAWAENDDWSISGTDNYIVVKAPTAVHARVPRMLDMISSMK